MGRVAEWLKAHAWRACGQRILSRGFESHPVRFFGARRAPFLFGAWLSPVERCVRDAEVPGSNPGAPIVDRNCVQIDFRPGLNRSNQSLFLILKSTLRWPFPDVRRSGAVLERWQNGIALASKASARKGLGVRIPRAP